MVYIFGKKNCSLYKKKKIYILTLTISYLRIYPNKKFIQTLAQAEVGPQFSHLGQEFCQV